MKRREFITLLGGAAATWPLAARAQQPDRMRRIGVLMNTAADDPNGRARITALLQELEQWGADDAESSRTQANEVLALAPDVIFATTTSKVQVLRRIGRSVPIVFAGVSDPVGGGLILPGLALA